jgi:MtN3 and saliva related transmembrane protein
MYASIFGYIGGSILAVQLIPQIIKVCRMKSAENLSFLTLFLNITGGSMVIYYGIMISQPPVYATVICSLSCNIILLICKCILDYKYKPIEPEKVIQYQLDA